MDEDTILTELVRLSQKYAKCAPNKLMIKCSDSAGNSVLKFVTGPPIHKTDAKVRKPSSSSNSSDNLRFLLRKKLLERLREDLNNPDWNHIPWTRLETTGWPANVPLPPNSPTKAYCEAILAALQSGKLHFKLIVSETSAEEQDEEGNYSEESEEESANERPKHPTAADVRHKLLEKVRTDLNEPEWQLIPWSRLEVDDWPKGVNPRFYNPTQAQVSMIERCLQAGILKFRPKEESSGGSQSDVEVQSDFSQQQMNSLGFVQ